uniref:Putative salivary kunitz domain protein n=1 Tax=Ixodes ricinus TaxID=34613 RepID=A0A147BWI0_IXORI
MAGEMKPKMQLLFAVALVILACIVVDTAQKERPRMPRICLQPPGGGRCRASHVIYFYNKTKRRCQMSEERGCPGEGNGFWDMEDCKTTCEDNNNRAIPKIL